MFMAFQLYFNILQVENFEKLFTVSGVVTLDLGRTSRVKDKFLSLIDGSWI